MGRRGGIWALFFVGYLELGLCVEPSHGAHSAPQLSGGRNGLQQEQRSPDVVSGTRLPEMTIAWIGPFELLSEEDIFGGKKKGSSAPPVPDGASKNGHSTATNKTEIALTAEDGPTGPRRRLQKWNSDVSSAVIDRVSRRLGDVKDGGGRAVRTMAARSMVLGREGGVWLRRRWRRKAVYCLVGVYGLRLTWRVISRIKANMLSSGDILLDAEDRTLASRGAVLDTEGQAILLRLHALGSPTEMAAAGFLPAPATVPASSEQGMTTAHEITRGNDNSTYVGGAVAASGGADREDNPSCGDSGGDSDGGWEAVESSLRDAISLRCVARGGADAGGRARYTEELSAALRKLEQARDEADMESFGPQHTSLIEQGVLLTQARLCDACLRSLRDGLIRASSDLSGLASFWKDQRSTHRRMGMVKSVVLGRLVHGQFSAKRLAVEKDQESISTAELLLEGYLERLGGVQAHLQARPKSRLVNPGFSATTAAGGATFTPDTIESLEGWVDQGMHIFIGSLEHVEAAFDQQEQTTEDDESSSCSSGGGEQPQDVSSSTDAGSAYPAPKRDEAVANNNEAAAARNAATAAAATKLSAANAVETFVSSVASIVANADRRMPSSVLRLRAGGGGGGDGNNGGGGSGGGGSARGALPLGARGTTAAAAATAAIAAHGKARTGGLPAVILLPPKRKKTRSASGGGGKKGRGGKDVREETPRKTVEAASPAKHTHPGSNGGAGGGVRWGKSVAVNPPPRDGKKEAKKGSKKGASDDRNRKKSVGEEGSRGLWGWLTGEEKPTPKKKVRSDGGVAAAKRSAVPVKERKDAKSVVRARGTAVDASKKKKTKSNDSKNPARIKAESASSINGKKSGAEKRKATAAAGDGSLGRLMARFGGDGQGPSPKKHRATSRSNGDRKTADPRKTEGKKDSSNSSTASTKREGPTAMGAATTGPVSSRKAGTRTSSSTKETKKTGTKRVEGATAVDGFGSRGGAGGRQENRLDKLGKDAEEGFRSGDKSSPLPPVAAALRRPIDGGGGVEKGAPTVPRTEVKASGAFLSGPSAAAVSAVGDEILLPGTVSSLPSSSTITLTPDVYARALQREEDYARVRRMDLTVKKHNNNIASVPPASSEKTESKDDDSDVPTSGAEPSFPIDGVAPTAENTTTVGALAACAHRCSAACGSIAASVSRGTVAVVTSPAKLVRLVASSVASSGTGLEINGESAASCADGREVVEDESTGSSGEAAATADYTGGTASTGALLSQDDDNDTSCIVPPEVDDDDGNGSKTGVLAFCVGRCTAACGSIFGGISSGAVEVVNSQTMLVGAAAGSSLVLSNADTEEDDDEEQSPVGTSAERESSGRAIDMKARDGAGGSSTGSDTDVDPLLRLSSGEGEVCRSVAGGIAPGYEKLAETVHTMAGNTAFDSTDDEKDERAVAAAAENKKEASTAAATDGRMSVPGLVTRPLHAVVVRPCAHLCGLAAAATPPLMSAPGNLARGLARNCGRAGRSARRAGGDASRAIGAGCDRAGRSTATVATAAWLFTAATACMLGDAVAQGAVKSTKACVGCVELAGRVLVVLPASTASRIVGSALHPFSGGSAKNGTAVVAGAGAAELKSGEVNVDQSPEMRSSSSASPTASVGGLKRWASRVASYPGFLLGKRSSSRSPSVTTDLASPLDGDVASVVLTSPPPLSAQEAQAALFRWTTSAPSADVPESSGRRSRLLVGGAARAGQIVVPNGGKTSGGSKSTAAAVAGVSGGTRAPRITRALRVLAAQQAAEAGAARPAHWRRVRRVMRLTVGVPVAVRSARYAQSNRAELGHVATEAATGVSSFFSDQLWQPCEAIGKQVFFQERANLMDKDSLEDAETSLQNMLRDFVNDEQNEVPEDIREEAAETMDMSVVSRKLEKETKSSVRGTVNGRIPRMLLIQATFLKKELLHLMEAIDELFQANQVTLKLISVVPAALLIFAAVKVSTPFVHAVSSRRWEPTALVHRSMRASLREMERLLTSSRGFVGSRDLADGSAGVASLGLLEDQDMGKMALHLHKLQTTLRLNGSRFDSRTRRKLEEDLADLMARGRPTVSQQVAVVGRMQRSYAFLRSEGGGGGGK